MAYGGLNKQMDAAAELGRNPVPVCKHQYGDEHTLTRDGIAETVS